MIGTILADGGLETWSTAKHAGAQSCLLQLLLKLWWTDVPMRERDSSSLCSTVCQSIALKEILILQRDLREKLPLAVLRTCSLWGAPLWCSTASWQQRQFHVAPLSSEARARLTCPCWFMASPFLQQLSWAVFWKGSWGCKISGMYSGLAGL